MKLSDYLLYFLKNIGVKHSFLVTGGALSHIVNSFDETKNLKYICNTHEQGAAIAAESYSRITGNLGVAMATSGPGATNLITGIACAYFDSIPTLYITGQVNTYESSYINGPRQIGFQETDIVSIVKPITKFAEKINDPNDIKYILEKAIYIAKSDRPGPVLIDIPMNIQRSEIDISKLKSYYIPTKKIITNQLDEKIDKTIDLIKKSKRPIIILGAGIKSAKAEKEVKKFIEKTGIPVVTSWGGIDILPHDHELFVEAFGVAANRVGNFAVQNSDLVIALGARLDTRQTGGMREAFAREAKKVIVDIDDFELNKLKKFNVDVSINIDVKIFLDEINNKIEKHLDLDLIAWKKKIKEWKIKYPICKPSCFDQKDKVNPYVFMNELSKLLKEGDIISADTGANLAWTMQGFKVKKNQKLFSAIGHSPMGYSLPASIGACFASNKKTVICITGDGGIKMNIGELETVVRYNLPIKIFVINNHEYGMIKQFQDTWLNSSYKASSIEGGLGNSDLVKIAKAFGLYTVNINFHKELKDKILESLNFKGPVLCSVEVKHGEKNIPKLEYRKPLEDSSPLLERYEFESNMIIKPLNDL